MATIALNALGRAIGGPVGGAIGAILGQQIDRSILGPSPSEGPRLKELDVQTSSYGSSVPAIFGAMRVAGTVIWATDLIESRVKSSGGKGRPATVDFSYSANLAIALSSRPLARIGRIWADGNLLRGAAGDFKVQTGFRFYNGHDDQPLDPLIASAVSSAECPAHRGLAYVIFEGLQLADFGNHIPSLTFEVFEREGDVPLVDICSAASGGEISGTSTETVIGFSLDGRSAKLALSPLFNNLPVLLLPRNAQLEIVDWSAGREAQNVSNPVSAIGSTSYDRPSRQRLPSHKVPNAISLRYYEPARDFQIGVQRSERFSGGQGNQSTELPAALSASSAQRLADLQLLQYQHGRDHWQACVETGPNPLYVGDRIVDDAGESHWRINEIEHVQGAVQISASRYWNNAPALTTGAEPGANIASVDQLAGKTVLVALDLPILGQIDPGRALVAVAASGNNIGWRSAALSWLQNGQLLDLGRTTGIAIMGSAAAALPAHSPYLIDQQNMLEIQFPFPEVELPAGAGSPFAINAPLCWLSGELLRYGQASYLGQGRYRLTSLMRGCYGTESLIDAHAAGDQFILLDSNQIRVLDELPLTIGQQLAVEALGLGDEIPVSVTLPVAGNAIIPFAPAHGIARLREDGGLDIEWKRRSRINFGWHDGIDQPLVEESEQYVVRIIVADIVQGEWIAPSPQLALTPVEASTIPFATANWRIEVRQSGHFGVSSPLRIASLAI